MIGPDQKGQPADAPVATSTPVTAGSLPLPTGASTEATLALIKAKTDNLDVALSTRTKPADTQAVSIASMPSTPVTGTFWQATQPVSAASLPLPTGAALEATGNLEAVFNLLSELLREMRLQTLLLREGLGVDHDVDDLRAEQESTYD